jgi:hypothetical protein
MIRGCPLSWEGSDLPHGSSFLAPIKEVRFMKTKIIALAAAFLMSSGLALAESVHLPQAVEHTKAAITHGEAGHAPILVEHATVALDHAKASDKAEANPHTGEGIVHLEAAIDVAKKGDAAGGTTHAKEALKHLEMAGAPAKK